MVQLSLALACLLAGADAFAPIPTKVPHHTHEEPDTHEVPHHTHESESPPPSASPSPPPSAPVIVPKFSVHKGSCDMDEKLVLMWDAQAGFALNPYSNKDEGSADYKPINTADECWEACQAHAFDNLGEGEGYTPTFRDSSTMVGSEVVGAQCYCKDCACWKAQDSDDFQDFVDANWNVGTLSTLAPPDWKPPAACKLPFSKHQGVCGDSKAKISKSPDVISTATACWAACEMYKFAEPAHIFDSINSSCECRDKCTCWEDSANEGQAAARFTTLALPDWVPPNPDPNTAAEWATIFTAGEMCDGSA